MVLGNYSGFKTLPWARGRHPTFLGPRAPQGFTLIELMVVILVIGVLATMVWPTIFHQIAKARQARALTAIGTINRAQHDFFYERGRFSNDMAELGFAYLSRDDKHYSYGLEAADSQNKKIKVKARPATQDALRGYTGVVYVNQDSQGNRVLSSLVCQGDVSQDAPDPQFKETGNGAVEVLGCGSL